MGPYKIKDVVSIIDTTMVALQILNVIGAVLRQKS